MESFYGKSFYRVNPNNDDSFSEVVEVESRQPMGISISPNPAKEVFILELNATDQKTAEIEMYSEEGILVKNELLKLNAGFLCESIDVSNLKDGTYFTNVKVGKYFETHKLIIRKE